MSYRIKTSMLLIIFLGLIAKLASVCDGCDVGTSIVNNVDWNQFSGHWYANLNHTSDTEDNFVCLNYNLGIPEGNKSLITIKIFDTRTNFNHTIYGNATNFNGTGYNQVFEKMPLWNGRVSFPAVNYPSYYIATVCHAKSTQPMAYVAYRNQIPDENTMNDVSNVLQEKDINFIQQQAFPTVNCN